MMNEVIVLIGIDRAIISVVLIDLRKNSKTTIASKAPIIKFCLTEDIEELI